MRRLLTAIFVAGLFLLTLPVHAEIQTFEGVGETFMQDEPINEAKQRAELSAQRHALEQAGVYIKDHFESQDSELTEAEIITIAAGILHVTDTKFSVTESNDLIKIKAVVTAQIDIDELQELLAREVKARS